MLHKVGEIWLPMVEPWICLRHMSMTFTMPVVKEVVMMSLRCLRCMVLQLVRLCVALELYVTVPMCTLWSCVADLAMSTVKDVVVRGWWVRSR